MKHVLLLCDGMADYKLDELGGKTPMTAADKPYMNQLAKKGTVGLVKTVADGLKPGSDVANLSVLGYDPAVYYGGRSPLEAASIGIDLKETDVAFRANLVTLSEEEPYENKTILDYCAGDISTEEAAQLITYLEEKLGNEEFHLYSGVSYRHCLIWANGTDEVGSLTPPHDITRKQITEYLPNDPAAAKLLDLQKKSYALLKDHPVNKERAAKGLLPANSIWLWGEGRKKPLASFKEKYGLDGAMISAVDLLKGIGILADMQVINVDGSTGYMDTNFEGKAQAALDVLQNGADFVYVHVEAPDECGHRHEIENKVKSLEYIDQRILKKLIQGLEQYDDYKIMILPDHATPLALMTHTSDPVPFLMYRKQKEVDTPIAVFDEENAASTGVYEDTGHELMNTFINY